MAAADRAYPRFATAATVTARRDDERWEGTTTNVSRGGFCARFGGALPVGTVCQFDLVLLFENDQRSDTLSLPARVVWCTAVDAEHQTGVSFIGLSREQLSYLDLFIRFLEEHADQTAAAEPPHVADMFG